jgi:FAD/FMN-containing dehydrogenase
LDQPERHSLYVKAPSSHPHLLIPRPKQIKGNGRSTNPGFSSTSGITIAMYRFSEINYDAASQTVKLGAGLNWDSVYEALAPYKVNVVGGVSTGSGVAGVALNGGMVLCRL